jgi:diacylglycerol O-acyltransferase / wax synthase
MQSEDGMSSLDRVPDPHSLRALFTAGRRAGASEAATRPEPMRPVDAAWLRMECPENPMTITSVMFFDEPLEHDRLLSLAAAAVAAQPRLRQRLDARGERWLPLAGVELAAHLERRSLDGGDEALRSLLGRLGSVPLDRARPLWHLVHVEGFRGGSAIVTRLHHSIGDGAALVALLLSLAGPGAPAFSTAARGAVLRPRDLARLPMRTLRAVGHLLASPDDPPTSIRAPIGTEKRFAWSEGIPLARLQEIAHAAGATTNDVILAALAGALRFLLMERGEQTRGRTVHALVPVNLRSGERELGNRFGLVFAALPIGVSDPAARLRAVAQATAATRRSPEAAVALLTLAGLGVAAPALSQRAFDFFGAKASLVVTNVPGPREPVTIAGQRLAGLTFFAPRAARLGLGASVMSYAGQVRVGVSSDAHVCAGPERIVAALDEELDALAAGRAAAPARLALQARAAGPGALPRECPQSLRESRQGDEETARSHG